MKVVMTEELFELYSTGWSKRYKAIAKNRSLLQRFSDVVNMMKSVGSIEELKQNSHLHYEKLKYEYSGMSSVRLSNRYVHRLIFKENNDELIIELIEIDNSHYGNR